MNILAVAGTLLIGAIPIVALITGRISEAFYVLLLLSVALCLRKKKDWGRTISIRAEWRLFLALLTPLIAVLVSQAAHEAWHSSSVEKAARLSIAFPILLMAFLMIRTRWLRYAVWGVIAAGWASAIHVLWLVYPRFNRPPTAEYNAVTYGNLMLLFATITLYSLYLPLTRHPRIEAAFKWLTVSITLVGFVLTQTRTGWMAIPVFALIMLSLNRTQRRPRPTIALLATALAALLALGATSPALRERVVQGYEEVLDCQGTNSTADTSVCIRLQLWRASADIIKSNTLTGLGGGAEFTAELRLRVATGMVSPFVAENFGEPHNDLLYALSSFGILGGVGLILTYTAPSLVFWRRLRSHAPQTERAAAAMGLAVCLGFAVFGLTEFMFRGMRTVSLYVVLVTLFMALSTPSAGAPAAIRE